MVRMIRGKKDQRKKDQRKKEFEEQVVQKFPHGCPYCNQPISYERGDLRVGENEIRCSFCKKIFIKVVAPSEGGGLKSRQP